MNMVNSTPRLSLSMIVKNEEKYLSECLESVRGLADEIIIVDTGSEDRTIEIAESYGAKVYRKEWTDDFSAARNYSLSLATGKWVLYLDADERISPESREELKNIALSDEPVPVGYYCDVISEDKHNAKPNTIRYNRLFMNSRSIAFSGRIHEQIVYSLQENGYVLKDSSVKIIHVGYDVPHEIIEQKARRNLTLLLKEYETDKTDYLTFQIGQTYGAMNDPTNALIFFGRVVESSTAPDIYKAHALRYKAAMEFNGGNTEGALQTAHTAYRYDTTQPLTNLLLAKLYYTLGKYPEARQYIIEADNCNRTDVKKDFTLTADRMHLYTVALNIAASNADAELYNYFYRKYREVSENSNDDYFSASYKLINSLPLEEKDLGFITSGINPKNINVILGLAESYRGNKKRILASFPRQYKTYPGYLLALARIAEEENEPETAAELYKMYVEGPFENPAAAFLLISLLLRLGRGGEVPGIVRLAENKFGNHENVIAKLNIIKEKTGIAESRYIL